VAFLIEAIMKIFAMNLGPYLHNPWNKLDFIVVISSVIEYVAENLLAGYVSLSFAP
jgi:hypothetical protein